MERTFDGDYEVIVVDDGSRDGLGDFLGREAAGWPQLKLIRWPVNRGKGAAVRAGIRAAQGEFILFADADGATPIEDESVLRGSLEDGNDLAVGSRISANPMQSVRRTRLREFLGLLFSNIVQKLFRTPIRDTQCGFKMFRAEVAKRLFESCTEEGYLFDLYVIAMAERLGYRSVEIPIHWSEVPGSKMRLVRDSVRMIAGLWRIYVKLRAFDRQTLRGKDTLSGERR
jgi:dolichyl-phosphate beta-glucosyltransferase